MRIYEWKYKEDENAHIRALAQDFYKVFVLGDDDKPIATFDAHGRALAAMKVQQEIIEDQELGISKYQHRISAAAPKQLQSTI